MRLGIDLDGVVAQFNRAFAKVANEIWPDRLDPDPQPTQWNWGDLGMTSKDINKVWRKIHDIQNFWMTLRPYPENVRAIAIHRIQHPEDEIFYVTAREATRGFPVAIQSQRWLESCGIFGLGCSCIVKGDSPDKHPIYEAIEVDAIVDDKLKEIEANKIKGGPHKSILLDRPWNREGRHEGILVVSNLEQFFQAARKA